MVCSKSSSPRNSKLDAEEVRRLVDLGRQRGLVHDPGEAVPIAKNGIDAAALEAVRSQWIDVDPARARHWLENNFRNRPLSEDVVTAYARDMAAGAWATTHQGIAFNDRDELIDGQHRLHAIIRSGATIRVMVTFGLPSRLEGREMTTMDCVDRGRTRSVADQLKIQHGFKDGSVIAAVCASIGNLCYTQRTKRLSVGQTLEIFREFEQPITWVLAHRSRAHGLKAAGVLAAFSFAIAAEPAQPPMMFELLVNGLAEPASPIGLLHTFLISDDAVLLTRKADRALAELVLQAIHLEQLGATIERLEMSTAGADHFRRLNAQRVAKVAALFTLPGA